MDSFQIKVELTKVMQSWLNRTLSDKPWCPDHTAELMASAALNVLETLEELQRDLTAQGYDIP